LTDFFTILEFKQSLSGLKLAVLGDGNNVARSLLFAAAKLGVNFAIATPPGYELTLADVSLAGQFAAKSGAVIEVLEDPSSAVANADVIYTDVCIVCPHIAAKRSPTRSLMGPNRFYSNKQKTDYTLKKEY
jgi:ornithine carbamoyltransferase